MNRPIFVRSRAIRIALISALACSGWLAPLAAATSVALDETVDDFKKLFKKFDDTPTRVEMIHALEGIEDPAVVDALAPVLTDKDTLVVRAAVEVLSSFSTQPPQAALGLRFGKEKKRPIRLGLLRAISSGGYSLDEEPFEEVLEASNDKDWELRLRANECLAVLLPPERLGDLLPALEDPEPAVRAGILDGLSERRFAGLLEGLLAAFGDEVWQVRASAIAASTRVRDKRSIPLLIQQMEAEEGRLVADCGTALESLTGRRFGQDLEGWKKFWERFGDVFEVPTEAEMKRRAEVAAEEAKRYSPGAEFFAVDTPSRSIRFVVDVSGSMQNLIVNREAFAGKEFESWARLEVVKAELIRTIGGLDANVRFDIVTFATEIDAWRGKLVQANALQRAAAIDWVAKLEPLGTAGAADLVAAGLGRGDASKGKTNTFGALMYAIGARTEKGKPTDRDDYETAVDTVVFLSDGRPTVGEFVDPDDIFEGLVEANELRRVVVHILALGQFQKTWMEKLAESSGGVFVDLGW